jgi:hypothetical protein
VALSLFANMENIRLAKVTGKIAKGWLPELYFVGFQEGRTEHLMGWAVVRDVRTGASAWNEDMRAFRTVYAAWHDKGMAEWRTDKKYLASEHQPVQLTTVYAVRAATELRSAEMAVEMLVRADQNYLEWYDATSDLQWTRLIGHCISPETGVTTRFGQWRG